jgi:hypothetical protein
MVDRIDDFINEALKWWLRALMVAMLTSPVWGLVLWLLLSRNG